MRQWWMHWNQGRERRKILLALYREVERNWEAVHVMQQRGVLDKFTLETWSKVKGCPGLKLEPRVTVYGVPFETYNTAMDDFKRFEQWYAADLENKTTENARILHGKKETALEKFNGLLDIAAEAKSILERDLLAENILTPRMIISHAE